MVTTETIPLTWSTFRWLLGGIATVVFGLMLAWATHVDNALGEIHAENGKLRERQATIDQSHLDIRRRLQRIEEKLDRALLHPQ